MVAAYLGAVYCIEVPGRPLVTLRIGIRSPELSALYREYGDAPMAFLTACNPLGAVVADD